MNRRFGPGFLVAAAFIGPGTVTTASVAGAGFGLALAWAVVCAIVATIILQEMCARLGVVAGIDLGTALRNGIEHRAGRAAMTALVLTALVFGNAAYQGGNLTGAALGMEALVGGGRTTWVAVSAVVAAGLLLSGAYRVVETALIALVALMGVVFVITAVTVGPELGAVIAAAWPPRVPDGSGLLVLALVGTTVVPYNLFLHASAAREKWGAAGADRSALGLARRDTVIGVCIGGVVTLAVLVTAVPLFLAGIEPEGVASMASQLEPLLGTHARALFAAGLFAAGLTSAITAPLAAAWATAGLLGWPRDLASKRLRAVWAGIMVAGVAIAVSGARPVEAIVIAQATNGLLLPVVAGFLLWVMNRPAVVGAARNGTIANLAGGAVLVFTLILFSSTAYRIFLMFTQGS